MSEVTEGDEPTDAPADVPADRPAESGAAPTRPSLRRWLAAGAVVVVVGVLAVLAVVQWRRADDLDGEQRASRQVRTAAATFGEAYLSYDFRDVEQSGERVRALVTEAFAEEFDETRVPGLEELFANIETTTTASTQQVFVGAVGDDAATALVVVDVTAASTATGPQVLRNLTFVLDLVRVDGRWLVDGVAPAPRPEITGPEGETTTSTAPTATTAPTTAPP